MHKCSRCKYRGFGKSFGKTVFACKLNKQDLSQVEDDEFEVECDGFKSRYIEYPLTISAIEQPKEAAIVPGLYSRKVGCLVGVRPCGEEYGGKTYLGILLGEVDIGLIISHHPETLVLSINRMHNPAMFVPELKEVIYGQSSWWSVIESEDELKAITDDVIANQWYVKLFKDMTKEEDPDEQEDSAGTEHISS